MSVAISSPPKMTVQQFADMHDLTIKVDFRSPDFAPNKRWYARFHFVEVKENGMLRGGCGDGFTPQDAILNYGKSIVGKTIVLDAMTNKRREINVNVEFIDDYFQQESPLRDVGQEIINFMTTNASHQQIERFVFERIHTHPKQLTQALIDYYMGRLKDI